MFFKSQHLELSCCSVDEAIPEALHSFPTVPPSSLPFIPLILHEIAYDPLLIPRHFWEYLRARRSTKIDLMRSIKPQTQDQILRRRLFIVK